MKILDDAALRLGAAGIESPRLEARLLLGHAAGLSQTDIAGSTITVSEPARAHFETLLARRIALEPLAYILGRREFWSLDFAVGPGVLIPRPETETLIESALRQFPKRDSKLRVLDLGTGSGCLLLAFLSERPKATGIGVDISPAALAWAERNADDLGLAARARFVNDDWGRSLDSAFDVVFANPPYVRTGDIPNLAPDVSAHEPAIALDGGQDGLHSYRAIAAVVLPRLSSQGRLFLEIGQGQAEAVREVFGSKGFVTQGTVNDLARIDRCLMMVACAQHSRQT